MSTGAHVIVLGAGVSGLGAAWRLTSRGCGVDVLEANPVVGGLARTQREGAYCLDVGPHSFFSDDAKIVGRVLSLFDVPPPARPRRVQFLYGGRCLNYPLTAADLILGMGFKAGIRIALSYLGQRLRPLKSPTLGTEEETVRDWAVTSFGEHLYRTFFKPYTEQFWKLPCSELSARSIPTHTRMGFAETLRVLFRRAGSAGGSSLIEREALPTYYPATGFGEIPERMAAAVQRGGGRIHLDSRVIRLQREPGGWRATTGNGRVFSGTHVVTTLPLPVLCRALDPPPPPAVLAAAGRLEYRALTVLGLVTEKQNILGCGYVYVLGKPYNRVSEMNEFSPATSPPRENMLAVEIPCLHGSIAWNAGRDELCEMCIGALAEDGLLQPGDVKRLLLVRDAHAYPVYRKDYARNLAAVLDGIGRMPGLTTLGRCGEFMYMDIDACIKRAFDAADRLPV